MILTVPSRVASLLRSWLARSSRTYGQPRLVLPTPDWSPDYSQAYANLAAYGNHYRHDWRRKILPLYGKSKLAHTIVDVEIPPSVQFRFRDDEDVLDAWPELPAISLRPIAHRGDTRFPAQDSGTWLLSVHQSDPRRPEVHRRRHDQKVHKSYYRRGISLSSDPVDSPGEYLALNDAFRSSRGDPAKMLTHLAVVRSVPGAIDHYHGLAHRQWPFPAPYRLITSRWR